MPADLDPGLLSYIYVEIALRDEYRQSRGRFRASGEPAQLRRWERPVAYRLEFGDSVPESVRQRDRAAVEQLVGELASSTGHPLRLLPAGRALGGNFHVLVLNEAERRAAGPRLQQLVSGIDDVTLNVIANLPRSANCLVAAFARGGDHVYTDAVAIIRAELPDLTRTACYHEELAQGLGLVNDSPVARPSMFNDAHEYARLTGLDRLLLQLHYDSRLRAGMSEQEARPVITEIAAEILGAAG
ncbi:MAG: DUF2927 domain-containing protein [Pararhodobacter sp.]|nr:DUF2927 domain-containing protein [Pararhodobacter sp.]